MNVFYECNKQCRCHASKLCQEICFHTTDREYAVNRSKREMTTDPRGDLWEVPMATASIPGSESVGVRAGRASGEYASEYAGSVSGA